MYAKEVKCVRIKGESGSMWFLNGFPTLRTVVMGLYEVYCDMIDVELMDRTEEFRETVKQDYKEVFEFILYSVDHPDVDKPVKYEECCQPNSKVVCLILYLYSIEPPFYKHINQACKNQDRTKLRTLGPMVRILYQILIGGGTENSRDDRIITG